MEWLHFVSSSSPGTRTENLQYIALVLCPWATLAILIVHCTSLVPVGYTRYTDCTLY